MNIPIEKLIKMMDAEQLKKDSAFTLLSKLGYTYDYDNGWDKEELFTKNERGRITGLTMSGEGQQKLRDILDSVFTGNIQGVVIPLSEDTPKHVTFDNVWDLLDISEDGFDNLVRSDYIIQEGDYFKLNKLSEEQKEFLQKELPVYDKYTFYWTWGYCYYDGDNEFVGCDAINCTGKELSFNLLFVEKSK